MLKTAMSHPAPVPYSPGLPYLYMNTHEKPTLSSLGVEEEIQLEKDQKFEEVVNIARALFVWNPVSPLEKLKKWRVKFKNLVDEMRKDLEIEDPIDIWGNFIRF